jgi:hypothetical protein
MSRQRTRASVAAPAIVAGLVLAACSASPAGRTDGPPVAPAFHDTGTPVKSNLASAPDARRAGPRQPEVHQGEGT